MSEAVAASSASVSAPAGLTAFLDRHHFLLRRLHSLSGIVPVGVFLCFHLFTNAQMLFGTFQHEVNWIHSLPALIFTEVFGLWLPIAFHAALGLVYTFSGRPNSSRYTYGDNWRYTFQRITGIIALVFIFLHIATLRWRWTFGGLLDTPFVTVGLQDQNLATASTAIALQSGPLHGWLMTLFYIVGVFSVVYHFANGLWTAAITWGLTVSVGAQKRWGYVCAVVGLTLAAFSATAIYAARSYQVTEADRAAIKAYVQNMESSATQPAAAAPAHKAH